MAVVLKCNFGRGFRERGSRRLRINYSLLTISENSLYQCYSGSMSLDFTQALGVIPVDFLKKSLKTDLELKPLS